MKSENHGPACLLAVESCANSFGPGVSFQLNICWIVTLLYIISIWGPIVIGVIIGIGIAIAIVIIVGSRLHLRSNRILRTFLRTDLVDLFYFTFLSVWWKKTPMAWEFLYSIIWEFRRIYKEICCIRGN